MKNILLFGGTTETGKFISKQFKNHFSNTKLFSFSRKKNQGIFLNLKSINFPEQLKNKEQTLIISLAPIWLIVPFLEKYLEQVNENNILGLIITSSTSTITKKYAWNEFDKKLSKKLSFWENRLFELKKLHNLDLTLLRPTLIYGDIGKKQDNNLSFLLEFMRKSLILPIPKDTGLRQPIHYSQLGESILFLAKRYKSHKFIKKKLNIINIGGDDEITYYEMINRIKNSLPTSDPVKRCFIIKIPNRFFFLISLPFLIFKPKFFAALERISINMNGFKKASQISKKIKRSFPVNLNIENISDVK
ncbi:NAD(P)-dependent oxidoreductase [Prochlorococcus marinus XMU1410]|uniref:NAD(P)-dependent oxidoreductase n=1 Tax=Prochlorococcus marinus TaxID=1219 RepID=UPI001ADA2D27|nr:NAD(P)-dependent oxidoreductase [Prochlorococcus marinus]MBO8242375.1 NAD(P)-dependent oxidoreductase [Prochlorococcus marinus XMU1410]MBW3053523.1 hypothetical protein [Prochlorococcus marinus str. MU1410]